MLTDASESIKTRTCIWPIRIWASGDFPGAPVSVKQLSSSEASRKFLLDASTFWPMNHNLPLWPSNVDNSR